MILDPSDPTGIGLFSKCARNHASKSKPSNRPASSHPTVRTTQAEALRRKSKPKIGFDKQTSREQREKMYKSGEVPAVGHYHFQTDRKPKLVWDILRAYSGAKKQQLQRQQRLQRSHYSQHMPQQSQLTLHKHNASAVEGGQKQQEGEPIETENNQLLAQSKTINQGNKGRHFKGGSGSCIVNMSKMTGRKERELESKYFADLDVMHSFSYVRAPAVKKIDIGARKKHRVPRKSTIDSSGGYDYDYRVVKPKAGAVNFGAVKGRSHKIKTEMSYSYQHYDYDSYVWQSRSHVYPNTKTHGISFDKQTDRYRRNREEQEEQ